MSAAAQNIFRLTPCVCQCSLHCPLNAKASPILLNDIGFKLFTWEFRVFCILIMIICLNYILYTELFEDQEILTKLSVWVKCSHHKQITDKERYHSYDARFASIICVKFTSNFKTHAFLINYLPFLLYLWLTVLIDGELFRFVPMRVESSFY